MFFGQVSLGIGELRNSELIDVGEKHRWLCDGVNLSLQYLLHRLQFAGVPREVWRVGLDCG